MRNFEQRKAEILKRSSERIKRRKIKISIISISCVFVMILAGVGAQYTIESRNTDPIYKKISKFPKVKYKYNGVNNIVVEDEMIAIVPPWDELTVTEQYSELEFGEVMYSGRSKQIAVDMLSEELGQYTIHGFDDINQVKHTKNATVYSIKNISSDCVVAVKPEGVEEYYIYTNAHYKPKTLGDFIKDLNLKEIVSFGDISYNYSKIIDNTYINERVEFTNIGDKVIWEKLLSDTKLKNVYSDEAFYEKTVISISVDIEILGYKNIGLWITEDGYMQTNILDTGKAFYIGKEKVAEVTDYLLDNCEGKRYVFTTVDESMNDTGEYEESASFEVKGSE